MADAVARAEELKQLALKLVAKSDFAGAVKSLTEAIGLRPSVKELWSNRAFAWSSLGKHTEALADAQQCIAIAPGFSKGYLRAGRALIALGRCEEAAALLEDAAEKMPQDYALMEALDDAMRPDAGSGAAVASAGSSAPPTTATAKGHCALSRVAPGLRSATPLTGFLCSLA